MDILSDSYSKLQTLYSIGKKVSIIGDAKRAGSERTVLLEKMVEKILLHNHSILLLFSLLPEQMKELDISLIASAARNIMETTNIYFHIAQRKISAEEVAFRSETLLLNLIYNEIDITQKLGFAQDCFHGRLNHLFLENTAERFQQFPQYIQLSEQEKNQILSGRKPAFQMKSPHILPAQSESAIYNLLSNSIHSLPLGLGSNSVNGFSPFQNFFDAERLSVIALQVSILYTAHVIKDYLDLRKHLYTLLTQDEKKQLKLYMSAADLEDYIRTLCTAYEKDPFYHSL